MLTILINIEFNTCARPTVLDQQFRRYTDTPPAVTFPDMPNSQGVTVSKTRLTHRTI